jgi:hypothetical protein
MPPQVNLKFISVYVRNCHRTHESCKGSRLFLNYFHETQICAVSIRHTISYSALIDVTLDLYYVYVYELRFVSLHCMYDWLIA